MAARPRLLRTCISIEAGQTGDTRSLPEACLDGEWGEAPEAVCWVPSGCIFLSSACLSWGPGSGSAKGADRPLCTRGWAPGTWCGSSGASKAPHPGRLDAAAGCWGCSGLHSGYTICLYSFLVEKMNPGGRIHSEHVNCGGRAGQLFPVLGSNSKVQMQKSELNFKAGFLRIWDSPREVSVISGELVLSSVPASLPTSAPPPPLPEAAGLMGHPSHFLDAVLCSLTLVYFRETICPREQGIFLCCFCSLTRSEVMARAKRMVRKERGSLCPLRRCEVSRSRTWATKCSAINGLTWEVAVGWEAGRVFRTDAQTHGRPGAGWSPGKI